MIKYVGTQIVFREIPDEITLAINISNCPYKCSGCHSEYLREDIGEELTKEKLRCMIDSNPGITCVCFMGGDSDIEALYTLAEELIWDIYIKVAWYSGRDNFEILEDPDLPFDYVKLGSYKEELGPLDNPSTNQRLYELQVYSEDGDSLKFEYVDITHKFWNEKV